MYNNDSMNSNYPLFFLLLVSSFFTQAEPVEELLKENSVQAYCYEKKKCLPSSVNTLNSYKKGEALDLNFSTRVYHGTCDTYNVSMFPYGSTVNLYIQKAQGEYYVRHYFGYRNESAPAEPHSPALISATIADIVKTPAYKITKSTDFHYVNIQKGNAYPFFSWIRSNDQNQSIQSYGFWSGGMFICDTKLHYEK